MSAPFRIGTGYDIHRLKAGRKCILGGIEIPSDVGPDGHSDADVLLHAITDAVLGALGEGDIGSFFPPSDPQWKDCPSEKFLHHALQTAKRAGYRVANVDATVISEVPKLRPHVEKIKHNIARILEIDAAAVGVKATTNEGIGTIGRQEGIAAMASALLQKAE